MTLVKTGMFVAKLVLVEIYQVTFSCTSAKCGKSARKFPDEKSHKKLITAGYSRFAYLNHPLASNNRIGFACKIITLFFLTSATMMWNLWDDVRAHNRELASSVEAPCFLFMRAQVDKTRLELDDLPLHFQFREKDIGTTLEQEPVRPVVSNFAKNLVCFNDIYSFEKITPYLRIQEGGHTGGRMLSSVPLVQALAKVGPEFAKRILWTMCREWERETTIDELPKLSISTHPLLWKLFMEIEY
ncbi:Aristolochene synthase in complex with 12,13-Difluorofarnesyl diphosphate [Xylaria acuta]|nr:Aristolochene synthase in complex with 12,13-Difluorofarnesyl diphosphate [Xylaria acuta]